MPTGNRLRTLKEVDLSGEAQAPEALMAQQTPLGQMLLEEEPPRPERPPMSSDSNGTALVLAIVTTAMRTLSERVVGALERLALPAGALIGGILLWTRVAPNPTVNQLVALGLYGALVLGPVLFWKGKP